MALQLSPMEAADMPAFGRIIGVAFTAQLDRLMFPEGRTAGQDDRSSAASEQFGGTSAEFLKVMNEDETARFVKVTDAATGEIVACGKWHVYEQPKPRENWEREKNERQWPPNANIAMVNEFMTALNEKRMKFISDIPCIFMHILMTHPAHHRRGAASMMLQRVANEADSLGLTSYLEASAMGRPLYERFGFEQIDDVVFDLRPWGGSSIDHHAVMLRNPRARN